MVEKLFMSVPSKSGPRVRFLKGLTVSYILSLGGGSRSRRRVEFSYLNPPLCSTPSCHLHLCMYLEVPSPRAQAKSRQVGLSRLNVSKYVVRRIGR